MNRGRPRYDDILTPREWEVLELIDAGLTNEQIADRLGISFGTAKYHVAEIISKLGVERREEAPDAARRARVPVPALLPMEWLRSRFSLPVAAGAIAAAVLLALSVVVLTDVLRDGSATSSPEGDTSQASADFPDGSTTSASTTFTYSTDQIESYYFEARIEADEDDVLNTMRAWYSKPERWRFEFGDFAAGIPEEGTLMLSDGEDVWVYNAETNTYSRQAIDSYFAGVPPEMRGLFLPTSLLIGPFPFGPEMLQQGLTGDWRLEEQADGPMIAGRPTTLYRYSVPSGVANDDPASPSDGAQEPERGDLSLWVDRDYPFVLRYEANNPGSSNAHLLVEITELTLNEPVDVSRFQFDAPEAALEEAGPADALSGSVGSGRSGPLGGSAWEFRAPEGFFTPTYFPEGFSLVSEEQSSSSLDQSRTVHHLVRLESGSGDFLEVEQRYRAGGMAESQRRGDPLDVAGRQGYVRTQGGDTTLAWDDGDVVVMLRTDHLSLDELVRVGASMHAER